jgi:hypothetical protein
MKTKLFAMLLLAGGSLFAESHFSFGVRIGTPVYYGPVAVAPLTVAAYRPAYPGPGYVWVNGYYDAYGHWCNGYWNLPRYTRAYRVTPRYYSRPYVYSYWRGRRFHDRDDFRFREHRRFDGRWR